MIEIVKVSIKPTPLRIGWVNVKYHQLVLRCNICVFKEERLFIRMPEVFLKKEKFSFAFWMTKKDSDTFQREVLKLLKKSIKLDLATAIELKKKGQERKKVDDSNKKSI
jgi:hypothetical protein